MGYSELAWLLLEQRRPAVWPGGGASTSRRACGTPARPPRPCPTGVCRTAASRGIPPAARACARHVSAPSWKARIPGISIAAPPPWSCRSSSSARRIPGTGAPFSISSAWHHATAGTGTRTAFLTTRHVKRTPTRLQPLGLTGIINTTFSSYRP